MRRRRVLAIAVLAAAVLSACDERVSSGSGDESEDRAFSKSVIASLCRAAEDAAEGDVAGAGEGFADVHGSVHELAAGLGSDDRNRAATARVLEAKQQVEADLGAAGAFADGPQLAGDLRALAGTVADATGEPIPETCG